MKLSRIYVSLIDDILNTRVTLVWYTCTHVNMRIANFVLKGLYRVLASWKLFLWLWHRHNMIAETFVAKHKFHFIHEREKTLFVIAASFPRTRQYKNETKQGKCKTNTEKNNKRITESNRLTIRTRRYSIKS